MRSFRQTLIAAVALTILTMGMYACQPTEPALFAGVTLGSDYEVTLVRMDESSRAAALRDIAATGAGWIRIDVSRDGGGWWTEPIIQAAHVAGLKVVALLTDWEPVFHDAAAVGSFAGDAARHYTGQGVDIYEVGNELNMGDERHPADASQYTADLQAAYRAIKAVNAASTVLVGGLGPAATDGESIAPLDFLNRMYAAGARGYFDAMNMHPYSFPAQPMEPHDWNAFYTLPRLHDAMVAHGDGAKKIWLTEFGAPTAGDPTGNGSVSEADQAKMIAGGFSQLPEWPWAGPLFVFNWVDSADGAFGMLRSNGSAKPALKAFVTACRPTESSSVFAVQLGG